MNSHLPSERLIGLRAKVFHTTDGTIISRGCVEVRIAGEGASNAIDLIFHAASGEGQTIEELCELFDSGSEPAVRALIQELITRRLLVSQPEAVDISSSNETHVDVFYWHFNTSQNKVRRQLTELPIVIFGVNDISVTLVGSLWHAGIREMRVVDHPLARNQSYFKPGGKLNRELWTISIEPEEWLDPISAPSHGCIIGTSDSGADDLLCQLNKYCLSKHCRFLPILLRDFIGYIGPLILPSETACYECVRSRQNSHLNLASASMLRRSESVPSFHPSMAAILGHMSALELTRSFVDGLPKQPANSLVEIDLLGRRMTDRTVLRVPRCSACSSLLIKSQTNHRIKQGQEKSRALT